MRGSGKNSVMQWVTPPLVAEHHVMDSSIRRDQVGQRASEGSGNQYTLAPRWASSSSSETRSVIQIASKDSALSHHGHEQRAVQVLHRRLQLAAVHLRKANGAESAGGRDCTVELSCLCLLPRPADCSFARMFWAFAQHTHAGRLELQSRAG